MTISKTPINPAKSNKSKLILNASKLCFRNGAGSIVNSPPAPRSLFGLPVHSRLYSSWRRHQTSSSLRPLGARSSHWYMPQSPSSPRAYVE